MNATIKTFHRYTITSEGASLGYFRLVEDRNGAWVAWAEVESYLTRKKDRKKDRKDAVLAERRADDEYFRSGTRYPGQ